MIGPVLHTDMCEDVIFNKNCNEMVNTVLVFHYKPADLQCNSVNTLQPLYNTVRYNTVLDITGFKDRSQKCIDYVEMVIFQYNLYSFVRV